MLSPTSALFILKFAFLDAWKGIHLPLWCPGENDPLQSSQKKLQRVYKDQSTRIERKKCFIYLYEYQL